MSNCYNHIPTLLVNRFLKENIATQRRKELKFIDSEMKTFGKLDIRITYHHQELLIIMNSCHHNDLVYGLDMHMLKSC